MSPEPFGRRAAAMITPFRSDGALDPVGARRLAAHLVDRGGCDALVLNTAVGEGATTSDAEKSALLRAVAAEVGDRAALTAAVGGTGGTRQAGELARACEEAGAVGLLLSPPGEPRTTPEQAAHHLGTVADATSLPVLLHHTPAPPGAAALPVRTLLGLAQHPRVRGVVDGGHDLLAPGLVLASSGLACYSGSDERNLALRALGAHGWVSTVANVAGPLVWAVLDAFDRGDHAEAARRHLVLLPLVDAVLSATSGAVAVKALFAAAGLPGGPVRGPLLPADGTLTERLTEALRTAAG
ncbi:dihydrodipicolinate synthase family protein [Streptomyces sp. 549]|uniref:dihydrodipicolinate synthase family protein n=1 Tax=Streptomyces sp. 549 TaxID=3049076 RepID=UPI0024C3DD65|nr:dihydrodipicolinate synthase family protein [Streptomyces sp. 549]MDK1474220.1 dihydrodipicolinate synthase family protein [Streptomyces sp. 549]